MSIHQIFDRLGTVYSNWNRSGTKLLISGLIKVVIVTEVTQLCHSIGSYWCWQVIWNWIRRDATDVIKKFAMVLFTLDWVATKVSLSCGAGLWILCSQSWRAVVYVTCVILAMLLSELLLSEWLLCTTLHDNILWCHVCHISLHNIQQCMHVLIYNYVLPTLCFQRCVSCDLNMIILVESTTDYCYQLPMCSFKQEVCRGHLLA